MKIIDLMAQNEIERCVMSSTLGIVYDFAAGNEELARDMAGHPELSGHVVVNPNYVEASIEEKDAIWT